MGIHLTLWALCNRKREASARKRLIPRWFECLGVLPATAAGVSAIEMRTVSVRFTFFVPVVKVVPGVLPTPGP
jgi:hypothetical protein